MSRTEAEAEAQRRNHDISGEPDEFRAVGAAVDAFVARAAQALDEAREELAEADRMIAERQARIGKLRQLSPEAPTWPRTS